MPKVTITTTDGETITKTITREEMEHYQDLPFTSSNVLMTEIKE